MNENNMNVLELKKIEDKNLRYKLISNIDFNNLTEIELNEMISFLADSYWPIRDLVAKKLIQLGPKVCSYLETVVFDESDDIRFWASQILSSIGTQEAIKILINSFAVYEDENEKKLYSVNALIKIGKKAIPFLIDSLQNPNELIRLYSVYCLGELKAKEAILSLKNILLNDKNFAIRRNAAIALGKIGDNNAIDALMKALSDTSWNVRMAATEALGNFKNITTTNQTYEFEIKTIEEIKDITIIQTLTTSLYDNDPRVREAAIRVLSQINDVLIHSQIIQMLYKAETESEKIAILQCINNICVDDAIKAINENIIEKLEKEDISFEIKKETIRALGRLKNENAQKIIIRFLNNENIELAKEAILALLAYKSDIVNEFIPIIFEDIKEEVRATLIFGLGKFGYKNLCHYVYTAIEDKSPIVRREALIALYKLMGNNAIDEIIKLIGDDDEFVALEAINLIIELKSPDAINALTKVIEKQNNKLSYMAFQALVAIGPKTEPIILKYIENDNLDISYWAISALEKIATNLSIPHLVKAFKKFSNHSEIIEKIIDVLSQFEYEIKLEKEIIIELLNNNNLSLVKVIEFIGKLNISELALNILKYLEHEDKNVRFITAITLGKLKNDNDEIIKKLVLAFKDKYWPVRRAASESLVMLKDKALKYLQQILLQNDNYDDDIIYWALYSISETNDKTNIEIYKKYMEYYKNNNNFIKIIIKGLGKINSDEIVEILTPYLLSNNSDLKLHAIKALKNNDSPKLLELAIKLLNDPIENVRIFAAITLSNFKSDKAINALKSALNDNSLQVVRYVKDSLSKIIN